jgi:hypothetical protein
LVITFSFPSQVVGGYCGPAVTQASIKLNVNGGFGEIAELIETKNVNLKGKLVQFGVMQNSNQSPSIKQMDRQYGIELVTSQKS